MTDRHRHGLRVLKFGGAALRHPDAVLRRIAALARGPGGIVAVVSARAGVTDRLERAIGRPPDPAGRRRLLRWLARQYPGPRVRYAEVLAELDADFGRLARAGSRASTARLAEAIRASGERLAVRWLAGRLGECGCPALSIDTDVLGLRIHGSARAPRIDLDRSARTVRARLNGLLRRGAVPVVTGYFGRSRGGQVRTLGRGGSDYSAVALAVILRAPRVELVKSDGPIRSAHPRWVRGARPVGWIDYDTAAALARAGSTVLHPEAIALARWRRMPIWVSDPYRRLDPTRIGAPVRRGRVGPILGVRPGVTLVPAGQRPPALPRIRPKEQPFGPAYGLPIATVTDRAGRWTAFASGDAPANGHHAPRERNRRSFGSYGPRRAVAVTTIGLTLPALLQAMPEVVSWGAWGSARIGGDAVLAVPERRARATAEWLHAELARRFGHGNRDRRGAVAGPEALFSRRADAGGVAA